MTNDYRIMLPLMAATVGSVYVSQRLMSYSIYTLKLHKRGLDFPYREGPERVASDVPAPAAAPHQAVANVDVSAPSAVSGQ